jgi:hypothetical protein
MFSIGGVGASSVKRKASHFLQNSSPVLCSIPHRGQMIILNSKIFNFLMKFYAFYVPQDKNILSTNFKAFSYHLKNELDIIEESGQKLSILKGTIPHESNPIK